VAPSALCAEPPSPAKALKSVTFEDLPTRAEAEAPARAQSGIPRTAPAAPASKTPPAPARAAPPPFAPAAADPGEPPITEKPPKRITFEEAPARAPRHRSAQARDADAPPAAADPEPRRRRPAAPEPGSPAAARPVRSSDPLVVLQRAGLFSEGELTEFLELEALVAGDSDTPGSDPDVAPRAIRPLPPSDLVAACVLLSEGTTDEEDAREPRAAPVLLGEPFSSDSYQERSDGEPAPPPAPPAQGLWASPNPAHPGSDSDSDSRSEFFQRNP
jgi:hypothetical protein